MLVRGARRQPRRRDLIRLVAARAIVVVAAGLAMIACSGRAADVNKLSWTLTPSSPAVGPATLTATLRDRTGSAVTGARVRLEGTCHIRA